MFDPSAPHIIILVIAAILLFGARRLPGAAKSLGESMHIFRKSVQGLGSDQQDSAAAGEPLSGTLPPAATPTLAAPADTTQQQLADLQKEMAELKRQTADSASQPAQTTQPR